jgi:serine/threonine protein kinase
MILEKPSTIKVDMWALGIILYQLIAYNNHPFPYDNIKKAI